MNDPETRLQELLASTPWSRLFSFGGRATNFPEMVQKVVDGTADEATFRNIRYHIEHQDTLEQASPHMTDVLIELLDMPRADRASVLSILEDVYATAVGDYLSRGRPEAPAVPPEDDLLPPFVSEDDDDAMFEDADLLNELWNRSSHHWSQRCLDSIEAARARIESLSSIDGLVGDTARGFFMRLSLLEPQMWTNFVAPQFPAPEGKSPLDLARSMGWQDVVDYLEQEHARRKEGDQ
ncbi:MAG: hypothetical protein FWH11_09540 [Micrococcales bacterium]|nr:hypothetical protein [Micrococcales bacterium]